MVNSTVNYNLYTRLPVRLVSKNDQLNDVLEVSTPHKGVVFIELKAVDRGIFRRATEIMRDTKDIINELAKLEYEAKEFLLGQWMRDMSKLW